jgi:hypothetical protein
MKNVKKLTLTLLGVFIIAGLASCASVQEQSQFEEVATFNEPTREIASYRAQRPSYRRENVDKVPGSQVTCKDNEFLRSDGVCVKNRIIDGPFRKGSTR